MDALLMPPLSCLLLAGMGVLLWRRRPRLARVALSLAAAMLTFLSLPLVSGHLLRSLQPEHALDLGTLEPSAQAILVLAGDTQFEAPEYGGATCGPLTLERLRYAARLARETGLPLCASGGPPRRGEVPHAEMMKLALERDFGVAVRWVEPWSGTTRENLRLSKVVLAEQGLSRVLLVTHAWHMPRALEEARRHGLDAVAAPTGFRSRPGLLEGSSWVPSAKALRESAWAFHEWIGRAWYALG
jgi:uncharacterized SAM-binding protein YcdF (DUF218 family)